MLTPSHESQAEVAIHRSGQVRDELPVLGSDREVVPGEWPRSRSRDVRPVAVVLRAVARAEEAMREAQRLAVDGPGLGLRQRLRSNRAPQVRAHGGDGVKDVPFPEDEEALV